MVLSSVLDGTEIMEVEGMEVDEDDDVDDIEMRTGLLFPALGTVIFFCPPQSQ